MSKKFFTNFRAAVDSYPLGEQKTGFMKPGRYNGYDVMSTNGALNIVITHSGLLKKTNKDNTFAQNFGAILFPTGQILHDDDQVNLVVDGNSGNSNTRIDFIIAEHNYQEVSGGTPVYYSVLKGPNNGAAPTLPNPEKQVILGRITITPNGYQYTDLTYKSEMSPLPGDLSYSVLTQYINQVVTIPIADESQKGITERATQLETNTGTDDERYVTPLKLDNKRASNTAYGLVQKATDSELLLGDDDLKYVSAKQVRAKGAKTSLNSNYALSPQDNGKVFINNSVNPIIIQVPLNLGTNVHFGFIAGLSTITIAGASGVTIKVSPNKAPESKSINSAMLLESSTTAEEYYLIGNLKNI